MKCAAIVAGLLLPLTAAAGPDYALDHVIVKFKTGEVARVGRNVSRFGMPVGARLYESGFDTWVKTHEHRTNAGPTFERFAYCTVPSGQTVTDLVAVLKRNPFVEYAEPDHIGSAGGFTPNDPSFLSQWHLNNTSGTNAIRPDIGATNMWEISQGATGIVLAVLDTGVNTSLTEFAGRLLPGYDFQNNDANPSDDNGHGTMVASVAAATGNNASKGAGVDWKCRILPVKMLDSSGSGFYSVWSSAIDYARTNGAKVINLSSGGNSPDVTLSNAIMRCITSGVIFVTISHNTFASFTTNITFPGTMDPCITVGASATDDTRARFSWTGPTVDLIAPGTDIVSVGMSGSMETWVGTSFAAPQVAGVCSLLAGLVTNLTQSQARTLLCAGADDQVGDPAEDTAGFDNYMGWGRLNAYATLQLARTTSTVLRITNSAAEMVWPSPSNASNKHPHRVQFASTLTGAWTTNALSTNIVYTGTNSTWSDTGALDTQRFYRIAIGTN